MIDLPLSIVAWISVVLVQAIIHYVVLGERRNRIQQQEEDLMLEESLSLATQDGSVDAEELCDSLAAQDCYKGTMIPSPLSPGKSTLLLSEKAILSDEIWDGDEPEEFLELLTQTGSELLKSRSVECMVEEQIRARSQ